MILRGSLSDVLLLAAEKRPGMAPAIAGDPAFEGLSGCLMDKPGPALGAALPDAATAAGDIRGRISPQGTTSARKR